MNSKGLKILQLSVAVGIIVMPIYCFLSSSEIYPFAPYSMYSHKHEIVGIKFFRIYCQNGEEQHLLTNQMIQPFDEARLTQSIDTAYFSKNKADEVQKKLLSLSEVVKENKFVCNNVVLKVKMYDSSQDFLSESGEVIEEFTTGLQL